MSRPRDKHILLVMRGAGVVGVALALSAGLALSAALACGGSDDAGPDGEGESDGTGAKDGSGGTGEDPCYQTDYDADGFIEIECGGPDCDDTDPWMYPGAPVDFQIQLVTEFPRHANLGLPEDYQLSAAMSVEGDVLIAFEGDGGVWFGQRGEDEWMLQSVSSMAEPRESGASIAVSGDGEVAIGFAQVDDGSVPTVARYDGDAFTLEALAAEGKPPVLATGPDGTLHVAVETVENASAELLFGVEVDGEFVLENVDQGVGSEGMELRIDSDGFAHIIAPDDTVNGRIPPIVYVHHTNASGAWEAEDVSEQVFYPRPGVLMAGTDLHLAYVRTRGVPGLFYSSSDGAVGAIDDTRYGFSDPPADLGTGIAMHEGVLRVAFATNDAMYLASFIDGRLLSTPIQAETDGGAVNPAAPQLLEGPDGLHLFFFSILDGPADEIQLWHVLFANGAPVGCEE